MNVPYLKLYRNGEFLQYLKDVLQLLAEQNANAPQLTQQQNALQPLVASIDTAFKQSRSSIYTQELENLDNQRDKALTGIRHFINTHLYHYNTTLVTAATTLFNNINQHGNTIQRLSYQEETAVLNSIIADWETQTELINAVADLKLTDWLTHLKTINTHFATSYLARVENQAANPIENIVEHRVNATIKYRKLITHINAHATLGTAEAYPSLLQEQISVLAGQYNQLISNRKGGNVNQNSTKQPSAPPTSTITNNKVQNT